MVIKRKKRITGKKISKVKKIKKARISVERKTPAKRRSPPVKKTFRAIPVATHQALAEKAKYYPPQQAVPSGTEYSQLPQKYGRDMLVLQVRDPWWIHAYWELTDQTLSRLRDELKDDFHKAKRVLRVYDISSIAFNGTNAHCFFDIRINDYAQSWYIDTGSPGRSWCVDLGLLLKDGRFITILRSNTVETPLDGPSWITDEEWMIPDELFAKLYGVGVGLGSSQMKGVKPWKIKFKEGITSQTLSSPVRKK